MARVSGFIVYPSYRIAGGRAVIELYGRLEDGRSFLATKAFEPYLFVSDDDMAKAAEIVQRELSDRKNDAHATAKQAARAQKTELLDFSGAKVAKIAISMPQDMPRAKKALEAEGIKTFESDIKFSNRFLIDNGILGTVSISGDGKKPQDNQMQYVDIVFDDPDISPAKPFGISPRMVAIDIETDAKASEIYSISMYSKDYKKVFLAREKKMQEHLKDAECSGSEPEMLRAFSARLRELDPDMITGWNLIDFDMAVLQRRFKHHNIPFVLGRNSQECKLSIQSDFLRSSSADFPGRVVLDGLNLLKMSFVNLEDYKLETAAREILGRGKLIDGYEGHICEEVEKLFRSKDAKDVQHLADYNLLDSQLVYEILEKKAITELTLQKSLITGLPMDKVRGSIAALDMLYLRQARRRGRVCPASGFSEREERVKGAFVMDPKFGIYENILVLDFKSLYPSIIRTFNIDPMVFVADEKRKKSLLQEAQDQAGRNRSSIIVAPNGAVFLQDDGILPQIIEGLWKKRDEAKKEGNAPKSQAIKIIMNSFYGVLANPNCRFYSLEMANAITSYAREIVQETAEQIRKLGYDVIYGDTDSVFVVSGKNTIQEAEVVGRQIEKHIDDHYEKKVRDSLGRISYLDLEFEKLYKVFLLPRVRGQETGAKKRYAGLLLKKDKDGNPKEEISITGLEFVRRDWTELAKEFQWELLKRVFEKKELDTYIKRFVKKLKDGELDNLLVYRKALRKDVDDYTKTTPPHVKAARLLGDDASGIIEYVMTMDGPQPVQKQKSRIDYEHYLEKQVKPIAESILVLLGKNFEDVAAGKRQMRLEDF